jgi:hypothetical protein
MLVHGHDGGFDHLEPGGRAAANAAINPLRRHIRRPAPANDAINNDRVGLLSQSCVRLSRPCLPRSPGHVPVFPQHPWPLTTAAVGFAVSTRVQRHVAALFARSTARRRFEGRESPRSSRPLSRVDHKQTCRRSQTGGTRCDRRKWPRLCEKSHGCYDSFLNRRAGATNDRLCGRDRPEPKHIFPCHA